MRPVYKPVYASPGSERRPIVTFRVKLTSAEFDALLLKCRQGSLNNHLRNALGLDPWPGDHEARKREFRDHDKSVADIGGKMLKRKKKGEVT